MHQHKESEDIMRQILARKGSAVSYKYPENLEPRKGILKDRVVMPSNPDSSDVPYWDVVDLIEFEEEPGLEWMRIGYYRKLSSRLVWGSQTTITEPITVWKRLLVHAAKEMPWFRNLLDEVMGELDKASE